MKDGSINAPIFRLPKVGSRLVLFGSDTDKYNK